MAFEGAFDINDTITVPLIDEATVAGMWDEGRRLQSYQHLIIFYDRIAKTFEPDDHQLEVVAKAARRAGALRMTLGDRRGVDDYARAIDLYEAMSAKVPGAIWYRTESDLHASGVCRAVSRTRRSRSGLGSPPSSLRDRRGAARRSELQAALFSQGSDPGVQRPLEMLYRQAPTRPPPTGRSPIA